MALRVLRVIMTLGKNIVYGHAENALVQLSLLFPVRRFRERSVFNAAFFLHSQLFWKNVKGMFAAKAITR